MRPLFLALAVGTALGTAMPALADEAVAATAEAVVEAKAPSLPAITVTTVGKRVLRDRVIATGLIAPVETVQVAPLIEGQPIETLLADVGDVVTEGQVLAILSRTTLDLQKGQFTAQLASANAAIAQAQAQLIEATASADEAKRVSDRTATLRAQGTASQAAADAAAANATAAAARVTVATQALEASKAQVALVESQLANIELQLSRTEVKSPVTGEITARNARVGAIASAAGQPLFTIIRDGALELNADVAEADVLRLAPGQKVNLLLVGANETLTGKVRLVEPTIDTATRLGRARITVDDSTKVRSGMFADAEILVAEKDTIAIPVTAVGSTDGKATVTVVKDGVAERRELVSGIRDQGWIEAVSGLAAGEVVVLKAGAFVRNGDHINPIMTNN